MDISLYMIVCIKLAVFVNDDPMLTIMEKQILSLLHKLIFGHSGFQNVNLEVFPVYGMEPGHFPVYVTEPENFFWFTE